MEIEYLANCSDWIPSISQWIYEEWGRFDPENTLEKNRQRLSQRLNTDSIPLTLVAQISNEPVGCVSLKETGMKTHSYLSPWIGSLYVVPEHRKQGIGSRLLKDALKKAESMEISKIYQGLFEMHCLS